MYFRSTGMVCLSLRILKDSMQLWFLLQGKKKNLQHKEAKGKLDLYDLYITEFHDVMMQNGKRRRYSRHREACDIQWVYYIYDVIVENRQVV